MIPCLFGARLCTMAGLRECMPAIVGAWPELEESSEAREGDARSPGAEQSSPLRQVRQVDNARRIMNVDNNYTTHACYERPEECASRLFARGNIATVA